MNKVEVDVRDVDPPSWLSSIKTFCNAVLRSLGINHWELSLLFCNNATIRELNATYRQKDSATDVLSFSQIEETDPFPFSESAYVQAGDIVISLEMVAANAESFKVAFEEELKRLIIHGILHLAGYDHISNETEEPMLQLQEQMVNTFSGVELV
jgi:probable rRNA maturation factor